MPRHVARLAIAAMVLMSLQSVSNSGDATDELEFEDACFDLDRAEIDTECRDPGPGSGWDLRIAYHADRTDPGVAVPNIAAGVEIAYLEGVAFDGVTGDVVASAPFVREPTDRPLGPGTVILLRTDLGAVFKLGRFRPGVDGLALDYVLLP